MGPTTSASTRSHSLRVSATEDDGQVDLGTEKNVNVSVRLHVRLLSGYDRTGTHIVLRAWHRLLCSAAVWAMTVGPLPITPVEISMSKRWLASIRLHYGDAWTGASTHLKPVVTLNSCGGIRLMSVKEPTLSGARFMSAVWRSVQFSPLKPHCSSSSRGWVSV